MHFPYLRKVHSTIDNSDGCEESLTGSDTTSDTSKTFFRVLPVIVEQERPLLLKDEPGTWSTEPLPYNIGKRNISDLFSKLRIQFDTDQTELALKKEIAWSLCGTTACRCLDIGHFAAS